MDDPRWGGDRMRGYAKTNMSRLTQSGLLICTPSLASVACVASQVTGGHGQPVSVGLIIQFRNRTGGSRRVLW